MAKSKMVVEATKPNLSKVRQKILNTKKHSDDQPNNVFAANNLERLKAKYPKVADESLV